MGNRGNRAQSVDGLADVWWMSLLEYNKPIIGEKIIGLGIERIGKRKKYWISLYGFNNRINSEEIGPV